MSTRWGKSRGPPSYTPETSGAGRRGSKAALRIGDWGLGLGWSGWDGIKPPVTAWIGRGTRTWSGLGVETGEGKSLITIFFALVAASWSVGYASIPFPPRPLSHIILFPVSGHTGRTLGTPISIGPRIMESSPVQPSLPPPNLTSLSYAFLGLRCDSGESR